MPTPGDRIRQLREARGWTQESLAERAKVSKGFLSDLEGNKRNISADYAVRIANALGASLDYLLRGETGQRERQRAPISIPPELSAAAQELNLSYAETLTLLDAHNSIVARRAERAVPPPSKEEWKRLHAMIAKVYPSAAKTPE
jgi:transcriptional regulator with XRE-family HTH domain